MVILLRDFESYGTIFMAVFTTLDFPVILDRQITNYYVVCLALYASKQQMNSHGGDTAHVTYQVAVVG
jgi:hypothetical protein